MLLYCPSIFLELYEFCLEEGYADKNLIAKWKKVSLSLSVCVCVCVCFVSTDTMLDCCSFKINQFVLSLFPDRLAMRTYVVSDASKVKIPILVPIVYVVSLKASWRR